MMAVSRLSKEKEHVGISEQCTQCGKCSSGCPAARNLALRPRRIALMAQRGDVEGLLGSDVIWSCTQCHQCMERCPRKVTPYDIIIYLQNQAVKRGFPYPKELDVLMEAVRRRGAIQQPQDVLDDEFESYTRDSLGLPSVHGPKDPEAFRRALRRVLEEARP
jgi:heterodisulfide reductase subunit C